jgi:hypothetical protein
MQERDFGHEPDANTIKFIAQAGCALFTRAVPGAVCYTEFQLQGLNG